MKLREWKNIESEFFELDEPNKIAKMTLRYHSPKELFDPHGETRLPLLKPETMAYLKTMLGYAPPKYKVELTLRFDDLGPYSEQQIADVVIKNSVLELKSIETATRQRDRLAYAFLAPARCAFSSCSCCVFCGRRSRSEASWPSTCSTCSRRCLPTRR